jgi:MSHA biogenesis protein MshJ
VLKTRELGLQQAIAKADESLRSAQSGLIEPQRMIAVLKEILDRQAGLSLIRIRNLPVRSLQPGPSPAAGSEEKVVLGPGPYLHPVEMELRGNYLDVLAYLRALESMPWGVQWQRFELSTDQVGLTYRVELATLSMEPNWLGV